MRLLSKTWLIVLICLLFIPQAYSKGGGSSFSGGRSSFSSGRSSFSSGRSSFSSFRRPSFSGGSHGRSGFSSKRPSFSAGSRPSSTKKSAFSGSTHTTKPITGRTPTRIEKRPLAPKWDTLAGKDMKKASSRKAYEKSQQPAKTFKAPGGKQIKINAKDKEISYLRGRLDQQKWVNRQQRQDTFYRNYNNRPIIAFNDCYHPSWNYYLMSQSMNTISMWLYMHQLTMDAARLQWFYSQNADLRARVAALEAQGVRRDPTWSVKGTDSDLAYNDGYVNAAFNPTPRMQNHYYYQTTASILQILLWGLIIIPIMILLALAVIWLIFYKTWD